ncbi:MAG: hypothetical protein AAFR38_02290 [Planctomycetota bacterium]
MPRASLDNPLCPRCGYDQSGIVATWETECPLEGVCTECGHAFLIQDAFGRSTNPRWYAESPTAKPIASVVPTLWMLFARPVRFWEVIPLAMPNRLQRLIAPLAFGLLILIVPRFAVIVPTSFLYGTPFRGYGPQGRLLLSRLMQGPDGAPPSDLDWVARLLGQQWLSLIHPLQIVSHANRWPSLIAVLLLPIVGAAAFVLLPVTLRRAKIQRRHLLRLGAVGVVFAFGWASLAALAIPYLIHARVWPGARWTNSFWASSDQLVPIAAVAICFLYWRAARDYLKLTHPLAVAFATTAIGLLLVAIFRYPATSEFLMAFFV